MQSFRLAGTRARGVVLALVFALLLGFALLAWRLDEAAACGGFFAKRETSRKPSLSHEQVLIVYDAKTSTQHFIREVTFKESLGTFGFVVPTPSRPEVAKVDAPPFEKLRSSFPFTPTPGLGTLGHGAGKGSGQGFGSGAGSVTVLEKVKVGSFTAFVLAADDEKALSKWLADNGLVSTPEADEWLAHYVRLKFYYVAMRLDPPKPTPDSAKKPDQAVRGETIRISFSTPAPFYPYLEPRPPTNLPSADRLLELWFVASEPMIPVALSEQDGKRSWVRPLQPGLLHSDGPLALSVALGAELSKLVPEGPVSVQTFQDQKFSRVGFGDILFVPRAKRALDDARKSALLPLVGLLDPTLVPARQEAAK